MGLYQEFKDEKPKVETVQQAQRKIGPNKSKNWVSYKKISFKNKTQLYLNLLKKKKKKERDLDGINDIQDGGKIKAGRYLGFGEEKMYFF